MKNFSAMFIFCLLGSFVIKTSQNCEKKALTKAKVYSYSLVVPADQSKEQFLEEVTLFYQKHPHRETTVHIVDPKFENCKVVDLAQLNDFSRKDLLSKMSAWDAFLTDIGYIGQAFWAPGRRYRLDSQCRLSSTYILTYCIAYGIDKDLPTGTGFDSARYDVCNMIKKYKNLHAQANLDERLRLLSTLRVSALVGVFATMDEMALLQNVPTIKQEFFPSQDVMHNLRESLKGRRITDTIYYLDEPSLQAQGRSDDDNDDDAPAAQARFQDNDNGAAPAAQC
ncbi:MAG TPA: hypothetical protein VLG50_01005 [Candidatus Saccharimonadales bacterium]|nr:hypothetical protein [Candidatus Saccharimonadales bacterium]